jgi:reactive intermediate/imine deaminase
MRCRTVVAATLLAPILACQPEQAADSRMEVEHLMSTATSEMGLPFSDAVRVGNMLYLSGQIGNVPGTLDLVHGGMTEETRQTLENIRTILERHGSSLDNVVKCTVMIEDMSQWPAMNEVYRTFFTEHLPARSAVGADGLALNAAVEIECFATIP